MKKKIYKVLYNTDKDENIVSVSASVSYSHSLAIGLNNCPTIKDFITSKTIPQMI